MKADERMPRESSSPESFLSRWSRRKAATGERAASKASAEPLLDAKTAAENENSNSSTGAEFEEKMLQDVRLEPTLPVEKTGQPDISEPLPAIESLTRESDFSPFMQADVAPALRNQAMKKLFTDPHYNIMDGLDIYIDDYGKPDPIPPEILRMMHQSKLLGLFDDEAKDEAATASPTHPATKIAQQPPALLNNMKDDAIEANQLSASPLDKPAPGEPAAVECDDNNPRLGK